MAGIRHTASTITDPELDRLYASRNSWQRGHETAEAQLVYERRRAAKAEAELVAARSAIDRVEEALERCRYHGSIGRTFYTEIRAALDATA